MLRLNQAELVERLYNLNGLRAENYLRWRRPEPAVLRELKPMKSIVASMMELYHLGFKATRGRGQLTKRRSDLLRDGTLARHR